MLFHRLRARSGMLSPVSFVDFNYIDRPPGSAGLVKLFCERRFNEGQPANGLSSIQSQQLACDRYRGWGGGE